MIYRMIYFTIIISLSSCVAVKRDVVYIPKLPNDIPNEISINTIKTYNYFYMYGIIVPFLPAWRSTDKLIGLYIDIGSDSTECPKLIYNDLVDYSSATIKYPDRGFHCWYTIAISGADEEKMYIDWKNVIYKFEARKEANWSASYFIN